MRLRQAQKIINDNIKFIEVDYNSIQGSNPAQYKLSGLNQLRIALTICMK
jgi:hypothetical protein